MDGQAADDSSWLRYSERTLRQLWLHSAPLSLCLADVNSVRECVRAPYIHIARFFPSLSLLFPAAPFLLFTLLLLLWTKMVQQSAHLAARPIRRN